MAKKFNEIPTWIKVATGVIVFAFVIWGAAWAASRSSTVGTYIISSHEKRITQAEGDISVLDKRMDSTEKTQIALQKDQQAILQNQSEMKAQLVESQKLQIEQIKTNAELGAYLKSIERIE